MRVFVRIGSIKTNKAGIGSRGWCIARRGTKVETVWGGVEVVSAGGRTTFYWAAGWPKTLTEARRTVHAADALVRGKVAEQLGSGRSGGYQRLPAGTRIYARRGTGSQ